MPTPEQVFFRTFTRYVKFRLTETGAPSNDLPPAIGNLVGEFEEFLKFHGGNPNSDAFKSLVGKISAMKEARGGTGIPPAS
jgi:hypothetical protein